jgi:hypothetical protein
MFWLCFLLELKSQRRALSSSTLLSAASAPPETVTIPFTPSTAVVEDAGSAISQSPKVQVTGTDENPAATVSPSPPPMPLPAPVSAISSPLAGAGESNPPLETPPHARGRGRGAGRGGGRGACVTLSRRSPSPTSSASDVAVAVSSDALTPARLTQPSAAAVEAAEALQAEHSRFLKCCVGEFTKLVTFVVKDANFAPQSRSVISNQGAP